MKANVLPTPPVQEFLSKNYVNVMLDADRPYSKSLMKQYGIRGIPCLMVFTPSGALKAKKSGAPSTSDGFIRKVSALTRGAAQ